MPDKHKATSDHEPRRYEIHIHGSLGLELLEIRRLPAGDAERPTSPRRQT